MELKKWSGAHQRLNPSRCLKGVAVVSDLSRIFPQGATGVQVRGRQSRSDAGFHAPGELMATRACTRTA